MNTKKAAEDFYFLQKLAKLYQIHKITSTKVRPSARESWRVPFGTGKSITDYLSNQKKILLYDPDEFIILKEWLTLFNSDLSLNTDTLMEEAKKISSELFKFLEETGFRKSWERILNNSKTDKQLIYQRNNLFDAFRTLKLMHYLRDTRFPMLDISSGIKKLFNILGHNFNLEHKIENYLSELKVVENLLCKNLIN